MEQIYTPKQDYKVLVRCFTYNQSKYIEDALNGFAMQQTNFPFVCLVMDDCSTDGEQEVIKSWAERECDVEKAEYIEIELSNIILVPHKTNTNCTFAFYLLKQNLYGTGKKKMKHVYPWRDHCEYEAICEGDDYWIASQKLQMQVNYLDEHKDVAYTCHRYKSFNQSLQTLNLQPDKYFDQHKDTKMYEFDNNYVFNVEWITKTLTCVFRRECYDPTFLVNFKYGRDVHMVYNILQNGKGVCFSDVMGVYRINEESTYGGLAPRKRMETTYVVYKELWEKTHDILFLKKTIECHGYKMYGLGLELPRDLYQFCAYFDYAKRKLIGLYNRVKRFKYGRKK